MIILVNGHWYNTNFWKEFSKQLMNKIWISQNKFIHKFGNFKIIEVSWNSVCGCLRLFL